MTWPEDLAERFSMGGVAIDLSSEEVGAMLRLSREVAHRTERQWAPVSTYVVGRYVQARLAAGVPVAEAVREAFAVVAELLPPAEGSPPPP
jgi:Domain of unknown function (DUF6457)